MLQAFMVVLREGVEAFLIVAIILAYLRKTGQSGLMKAVFGGVLVSILASLGLGYFLWKNQGANQPLLEGIFATVTVLLVGSLLAHLWKTGPELKKTMESRLAQAVQKEDKRASYAAVFLFTIVMICREGMEMTLLLFQIQDPQMLKGIFLGVAAAAAISFLWQQLGYFINWKHFFQITTVFLGLFLVQIAVQAFHEFTEAGIFPNSEALHVASEPYSTEGLYGRWYGNLTFAGCGLLLLVSLIFEKFKRKKVIPV